MPEIASSTLPQMTDLINRTFINTIQTLPQQMRQSWFVVEKKKPHNTWLFERFAERIEKEPYMKNRPAWYRSAVSKVQYWYEKDAVIKHYALEISITKEMRDAWKDKDIMDAIVDMSKNWPDTIDLLLAHRLTFWHSSSYVYDWDTIDITVWDWFPLFYTAHTLTWSSVTYSNIITWNPQFSKWALEIAERSFVEGAFDNFWNKKLIEPDTIVSTDDPNTINQIRELMKATANVDSNNAWTDNVYRNKYKHTVISRIATTETWQVDTTKRKYWGLVSSRTSDLNLAILNEPYVKTPMDWDNWEEFSSENWNYLSATDVWIATVTWKWLRWSKWDWS